MSQSFFTTGIPLPKTTDWASSWSGPTSFDDASSSFGIDPFSQVSGFALGTEPSAGETGPAKPGAESPFINGWLGGAALLEGVGNLIRGFRGMPSEPGMAGAMIQRMYAQQAADKKLNELLDRLGYGTKETGDALTAVATPAPLKTDSPIRNWQVGTEVPSSSYR